jgi:hypothetical protein
MDNLGYFAIACSFGTDVAAPRDLFAGALILLRTGTLGVASPQVAGPQTSGAPPPNR